MALEQEQQDGDTTPVAQPSAEAGGLSPAGASRRRLAGLGASGVLMTLASQSAMAGLVCKSPSGALSGNLASRQPASVACAGLSPGYWKTHPEAWAAAAVALDTKFHKLFYCSGQPGYSSVGCKDILEHKDFDSNNVGMHMMATYLNVASGKISFLTIEDVTSMWKEYITTKQYIPATGAKPWNAADIVVYLSSTMG